MYSETYNELKNILYPLQDNGWNFINLNDSLIVMNKSFNELDEINIEFTKSYIHFVLPVKNSVFSFYKKFNIHDNCSDFLKNYITSF